MSNREFPMMPWFPQDFAGATAGWTFVERSLYRCLLDVQWIQGKLPSDPKRLALICGMSESDFSMAWPQVSEKFTIVDGALCNLRLEEHREKSRKYHDQKVAAGKSSAAKRSFNGRSTDDAALLQHPSLSLSDSDKSCFAAQVSESEPIADPRKQIFDLGVKILGKNGRSLIAKALKTSPEEKVGAVLGEMALSTKADPVAYFVAAVKPKERGFVC